MKMMIVGATGLVGSALLDRIDHRTYDVVALVRSSMAGAAVPYVQASPDDWPDEIHRFAPDVLLSALGTTMRKAGSRDAFRAVDQTLVLACATAAQAAGARQMIAVSSVGANARASGFYLRVKGEVEDALKAMGFGRVDIMRPGLLTGDRSNDPRLAERLAIGLAPLSDLITPARYRSVPASRVAAAMAALAGMAEPGFFIHHGPEIRQLADGK